MADEVDLAGDFQEQFLADSIERQLSSKSSAPESKGFCLYCEEKTSREKRWCNTFCRDDWQRNEDSRRRKLGIAPVSMPIDDNED